MKFLREIKNKITNSKWFAKLKSVKNIEIIIAVILAIVAISIYFVISAGEVGKTKTKSTIAEMNDNEKRVAEMISEISGVGESRVLITSDGKNGVVGVVVVAEGVNDMTSRVKIIRLVEKATGASVDQIEIFEMEKGG